MLTAFIFMFPCIIWSAYTSLGILQGIILHQSQVTLGNNPDNSCQDFYLAETIYIYGQIQPIYEKSQYCVKKTNMNTLNNFCFFFPNALSSNK